MRLLDEPLDYEIHICVGISSVSPIPDLEDQVNRFIGEVRADGTLDEMYQRWVVDENDEMPTIDLPQDPQVHLRVGTSGIVPPYSYYAGSELTGYDIELARRFAAWLGADLSLSVYDYGAIIPAAESGQIDCIMADLQADGERRESFTFSEPLFTEHVGLMVRDEGAGGEASFLDGLRSSFEKTFVREDRWRLFAYGIRNTLAITLLSLLAGTVLGLALFLVCRDGSATAARVTGLCIWLVKGMPMVVLLMILYYVVFSGVNVSGIAVAVVGFTLVLGAAVCGMLQTGVGAVGVGQTEAASALGYADRAGFFRIVLPQAIPHVVGPFRAQAIELLKGTAVVGYVTVQDLTKMGDIVRSRTYEAFFPLVAVAVLYFVLEALLELALGMLERRLDPRTREPGQVLRGVDPQAGFGLAGPPSHPEAGAAGQADEPFVLRIEHLRKTFGDVTPLRDVSVEVRDGDVAAIIGPSGTGKSTLLRCLNLLERPSGGRVWLGDER